MQKLQTLGVCGIFLLIALLFSGCSTPSPVESRPETVNPGDLADFVQAGAAYAEVAGEEAALEEFSDKSGLFSRGDLYIYAYDFNGTLLAHPYEADKMGTDRMNWTDIRGLPVIRIASYAASEGGGYSAYLYPEPTSGVIDEKARDSYVPKIGYSYPVNERWWIGSGIYFSDLPADGTGTYPVPVTEMIALVEEGVEFGRSSGSEVAFAEISNRSGKFIDSVGHYLYAYRYDGTLLAHPYLPDSIGKNLIDKRGPFGMDIIRALSETADAGGGFVVFVWPNPDKENRLEQKIGYVLPVDEEWWVGSGVYLSEITGVDTSLPSPSA